MIICILLLIQVNLEGVKIFVFSLLKYQLPDPDIKKRSIVAVH